MRYRLVTWSVESVPEAPDAIGVVTLNRPDRMNAVGPRMALELDHLFDEIRHSSVRVVIVTGAGGNFCAGGDLKVETIPLERPEDRFIDDDEYGDLLAWFLNDHFHVIAQRAFRKLEDLPQPVIAAIDGVAVGVGLEMAISCDLRVVTDRVRLAEIAVPAGFLSEWGAPRNLPKLIGVTRATELILTGRFVGAEEALRIGLVNQVVLPDQLMKEAMGWAGQIAALPFLGVRYAKEMLRMYMNHNRTQEGMDTEMARVMEITRTEDCGEGIRALLEKRRPRWRTVR